MNYIEQGKHFGENKNQLIINDVILNKAKVLPNIEIPWHYHENAYFLFNLNGYLTEVTKKRTLDLEPGSLLFHHFQDPHYNKNITTEIDFFHVELTKNWFKKFDLQPSIIEGNLHLKDPSLKSIFNKLYIESAINDDATKIAVDSLVLQAFTNIIRFKNKQDSFRPTWIKKIKELIYDENWEKLSLTSIATEVKLHPVYLSRKFHEYFNMTLGDYIREIKLERACLLLYSKEYTIAQIAYKCGFSDESHFLKHFKNKFGITPNQFKKNNR